MDLRWGKTSRKVPQKGIEVMFALDVSRSMLAEDTTPNRLERAKQQINDMVDEMAGDRVGLVVFAGSAKRVVPLTSHYQDFKKTLDSVGRTRLPVAARGWEWRFRKRPTALLPKPTITRRSFCLPMARIRKAIRWSWPASCTPKKG